MRAPSSGTEKSVKSNQSYELFNAWYFWILVPLNENKEPYSIYKGLFGFWTVFSIWWDDIKSLFLDSNYECIRFCIILILLIYLQFNPLKIHLNTIFRRQYLGNTCVKLTFNVVHPKFYHQNNRFCSKIVSLLHSDRN